MKLAAKELTKAANCRPRGYWEFISVRRPLAAKIPRIVDKRFTAEIIICHCDADFTQNLYEKFGAIFFVHSQESRDVCYTSSDSIMITLCTQCVMKPFYGVMLCALPRRNILFILPQPVLCHQFQLLYLISC